MKKLIAPLFAGIILVIVLTSCGSTQGGHCEAYGSNANNSPSELPTNP